MTGRALGDEPEQSAQVPSARAWCVRAAGNLAAAPGPDPAPSAREAQGAPPGHDAAVAGAGVGAGGVERAAERRQRRLRPGHAEPVGLDPRRQPVERARHHQLAELQYRLAGAGRFQPAELVRSRAQPRGRRLDRAHRGPAPRQRPGLPARSRGRDLRCRCQRERRRARRLDDEHLGRELPRRQLRLPAQRLDRLGRQLRHAHGGLGRLHRALGTRGDQPGCDLGAARHGGPRGGRDGDAAVQRHQPGERGGRSGDGTGADREP